jgi:hypothetical protein
MEAFEQSLRASSDGSFSKGFISVNLCETHMEEQILYCLKDQIKVCSKCLNSTHLLHPVVPLNSLENLDFSETLN